MSELICCRKTLRFIVYDVISLEAAAIRVLSTENLQEKVNLSFKYVNLWETGVLREVSNECDDSQVVPAKPARPINIGGDSNKSTWVKVNPVISAIHGIAHAESWAMDLFWDCIARYARGCNMPIEFFNELVLVAGQEARHFNDWSNILIGYEYPYGTLPTHDGLWRCAEETSYDLTARLAIVNLVYEARGLDTYPLTLKKFEKVGDKNSVDTLKRNFLEEIQHVEKGVRWFKYRCVQQNIDPLETFHSLVRQYPPGPLKGPFNETAREAAGMTTDWYKPLTAITASFVTTSST